MNMEILSINLKLVEPILTRGSGEFDPSSRGVFTSAQSLLVPRPSTFVGMILSALLPTLPTNVIHKIMNIGNWQQLLEEYKRLLVHLGIEAIRGPYIIHNDNLYVPVMLGHELMLVNYDQLSYYLTQHDYFGNVLEKYFHEELEPEVLTFIKREFSNKYKLDTYSSQRVGIHLKIRGTDEHSSKVTKEGYLYLVEFKAYPLNTEITFITLVKNAKYVKMISQIEKVAAKFGGEGRVVMVTVSEDITPSLLKDLLYKEEYDYALLLSSMPLREDHVGKLKFIGKYDVIGLGYSIAKHRRKPLYSSLIKGTIVNVKDLKKSEEHQLRYGLYATLSIFDEEYKYLGMLGYASYVPLRGDANTE